MTRGPNWTRRETGRRPSKARRVRRRNRRYLCDPPWSRRRIVRSWSSHNAASRHRVTRGHRCSRSFPSDDGGVEDRIIGALTHRGEDQAPPTFACHDLCRHAQAPRVRGQIRPSARCQSVPSLPAWQPSFRAMPCARQRARAAALVLDYFGVGPLSPCGDLQASRAWVSRGTVQNRGNTLFWRNPRGIPAWR